MVLCEWEPCCFGSIVRKTYSRIVSDNAVSSFFPVVTAANDRDFYFSWYNIRTHLEPSTRNHNKYFRSMTGDRRKRLLSVWLLLHFMSGE